MKNKRFPYINVAMTAASVGKEVLIGM